MTQTPSEKRQSYLAAARTHTDLNKYNPKLADLMREQNILSLKELTEFVSSHTLAYTDTEINGLMRKLNVVVHPRQVANRRGIYSIESNNYKPTARALADAFNVSCEYLFGERPEYDERATRSLHHSISTPIPSPEEFNDAQQLKKVVNLKLLTLTEREERIIRMRFLGNMTLEEVGNEFHVTRERVRQFEAKALSKLEQPSRSNELNSFLDQNIDQDNSSHWTPTDDRIEQMDVNYDGGNSDNSNTLERNELRF